GGEQFGRAGGGQARHGVRDPGEDHRALRAGVRRARAAEAGVAGKRCRPVGGGAARAFDQPERVRKGIGGVAAGGRTLRERAGRRREGGIPALASAKRRGQRGAGDGRVAVARAACVAARAAEEAAVMRILLAQNSLYYPAYGGGG